MVPNFELIPHHIQLAFEQLTMLEQMFISLIMPIMSVYRLAGRQLMHRGYCANFYQDFQPICDLLPRNFKYFNFSYYQKRSKKIREKNLK